MSGSEKLQDFLDKGQYTKHSLERYEWIFGETFLSTGGIHITNKVLDHVVLKRAPKVLDIGSGLGGHSFLIAERYEAEVIGLDLSTNMVAIAQRHLERRPYLKDKVTFDIRDCTECNFPEETFDMIYSRDSFLHIQNKHELFKNIFKWLRPGGCVLFTDYIREEDENKYGDEFKEYLKKRGYHMATIQEYKNVMEKSGFKKIEVKDWSLEFRCALKVELEKLQERKDEFLKMFSQEDYEDLELGWKSKIARADEHHQGWVIAFGIK